MIEVNHVDGLKIQGEMKLIEIVANKYLEVEMAKYGLQRKIDN